MELSFLPLFSGFSIMYAVYKNSENIHVDIAVNSPLTVHFQ